MNILPPDTLPPRYPNPNTLPPGYLPLDTLPYRYPTPPPGKGHRTRDTLPLWTKWTDASENITFPQLLFCVNYSILNLTHKTLSTDAFLMFIYRSIVVLINIMFMFRYLYGHHCRSVQCLYAHILHLTAQQIQREEEPGIRKWWTGSGLCTCGQWQLRSIMYVELAVGDQLYAKGEDNPSQAGDLFAPPGERRFVSFLIHLLYAANPLN